MVFPLSLLLIAGSAAHVMLASPIPPPDCALDTPPSCTGLSDPCPHGCIPLTPRAASPCPLDDPDCGPIVVSRAAATPDPTPTSTTSATLATCTPFTGAVPIGEECFTSGPYAGQCISFLCLDHPDACGCPQSEEDRKRDAGATASVRVPPNMPVSSSSTLTLTPASSAPQPSATACTNWVGPISIGTECFTIGPYAGQCIPFYCLERSNICGCPQLVAMH